MRLHYTAVQNLVYGCGNVPETTADGNNTPLIHCAEHVQQSVDMSIQLPQSLQFDPAILTEVVQHEYVLVSGAWLYPRVKFANTVYL